MKIERILIRSRNHHASDAAQGDFNTPATASEDAVHFDLQEREKRERQQQYTARHSEEEKKPPEETSRVDTRRLGLDITV